MTTPQSSPDEPNPPKITPRPPISPEEMAARERLHKKWPRPPWALKAGTVVVSTTLSPQSSQATGQGGTQIAPSQWTLTFQSGMKVLHPTLARIVTGIENLHPGKFNKNETVILEATGVDGSLIGFVQVACGEDKPSELGTYIAEVRVNLSPDGANWDLLKAGRKEPAGAVVDQSKQGLFKTYENECLSTEQVLAIAEFFFLNQNCHPDFQWRSIREDLEAQRSRK